MLVSCIFETSAPICLERFQDYKMLGRFTIRDEGELLHLDAGTQLTIGKTVGIGKVTKLLSKDDVPDVSGLKVE